MHDACLPTGNGSACLANNHCGCTNDTECAADRMCDVLTARCVVREVDAGVDAGTDASVDSGTDAGRDGGTDAGTDASMDSGPRDGGDGGTTFSLTGNGACGCAVPGTPTRAPWSIGVLVAVGAALASRRRRGRDARV
jgi:MYXO-CTERM domain-containing protein